MTPTQIDSLRDLAIEHLPRAKADRAQIQRFSGTPTDFYSRLAHTAVMVRANASATALECAAANVLEAVALLCMQREEPLTRKERDDTLGRLAAAAKELCALTGTAFPWLASVASPEPEEEAPAPVKPQPLLSIAGRFLTTKEAAKALGYAEQTLRGWASTEGGPIRPSKLGRQNRWSGDEILALLSRK
jgi:predicted DNA-binding transcriptional regulator AlpA